LELKKNGGQQLEGFIFIIDNDGNIIDLLKENYQILSLREKELILDNYYKIRKVNINKTKNPQIKELSREMKTQKRGLKLLTLKGENYILTFSRIRSVNWTMVFVAHEETLMKSAIQTHAEMMKTEENMTMRFVVLMVCFLIITVLVTLVFFRRFFLQPLTKIRQEIRKMGDGNFDLCLKEEGAAEITELSSAFNLLGYELNCYMKNLKEESAARQAVETEIEIAARVQNSILPKITSEFESDKFKLYANLKPAKDISGDFYDFFFLDKKRMVIVIADVSGKGLSAAFFMAMSKILIKSVSLKFKLNPAKVLKAVNSTLCMDNSSEMFATVFLAYYDITTGELVYSNAGHHSTILFSCDGKYEPFGIMKKTALGIYSDAEYKNEKKNMDIGETVLMYTDGVTESISPQECEYGDERLKKVILKNKEKQVDKLCDIIIENVRIYEEGSRYDDITVLALKRLK
jgi:phosphoserine phosphatase RsbU/P